jgi:hypothetical protein
MLTKQWPLYLTSGHRTPAEGQTYMTYNARPTTAKSDDDNDVLYVRRRRRRLITGPVSVFVRMASGEKENGKKPINNEGGNK